MEKTNVPPIKVNYSNGSKLTPNQQLFFKNLEWGIGLDDSTMYLSYEIDQDQLYAVMTRFDGFVKMNPLDYLRNFVNKFLSKVCNLFFKKYLYSF